MAEKHEETVTVSKKTYKTILSGVVVLLVAAAFLGGFTLGSFRDGTPTGNVAAPQPTQAPAPQQPAAPAQAISVKLDGLPMLGDPNAKVTLVEFSDFECPFCGRAYTSSLPGIKQRYVETGQVKFYYGHFPLSFHPQANPAALASECANEQGKFWEFHDALFENQASLSNAFYSKAAADLGLNVEQFNSCLASAKYQSEVDAEFAQGQAVGVSGTPTFFACDANGNNCQRIVGAQPESVIEAAIRQHL